MSGLLLRDDLLEDVRRVRDDAVDAEVDESADLCRVIRGPRNDSEACLVEFGYVDRGIGAENSCVVWREHGRLGVVCLGVLVGSGHESEERVRHRGLLGGDRCGGEEDSGKELRSNGG